LFNALVSFVLVANKYCRDVRWGGSLCQVSTKSNWGNPLCVTKFMLICHIKLLTCFAWIDTLQELSEQQRRCKCTIPE